MVGRAVEHSSGAGDLQGTLGLERVARRLGEACSAEWVILFGSRAKGTAARDSDVDLALIVPYGTDARTTLRQAHRLPWPREFPVDLVLVSASDWREKRSFLSRQITDQGVVLYERGAA